MKLSEKLLQQQRIELDAKPLIAALRTLRKVLEENPHPTHLFVESLAKRPTIAVGALERDATVLKVTLNPARELALFLQRVRRFECRKQIKK